MDDSLLLSLGGKLSPCYVFDADLLKERVASCRRIVGPSVSLCYSIKANPFLVSVLSGAVDALEVCSPGELEICHASGLPANLVLYSGVTKTAPDIARALDLGVRRFTCESPEHARLLNEAALSRGIHLPVLLRLTAGSQFGMDERDLRSIVSGRERFAGLSVEGIHYFAGTQQKRLAGQRKQLAKLADLIDALGRDYGFSVREVEYGPGLYFPYFDGEDTGDTLAPLRELAPDLRSLAARCRLTIEMGRFFVSPCGVYLTRVVDAKENCGSRIAILDGGMHHVNYYGGSMGMRVPVLQNLTHPLEGRAPDSEWMLCGSLCTTADVLVRSAPLREVSIGDVIAFRNVGAYSVTEAPALFLSRDLPRIFLYENGRISVLRNTVSSWRLNLPDPDPKTIDF